MAIHSIHSPNGHLMLLNGHYFKAGTKPNIPEGTDFIYLAKDYENGVGIANTVQGSSFGTYGIYSGNNLNKIGTGAECYLTNNYNDSKRLQMTISNEQLNAFKAIDNVYTFFVRVYSTINIGGVFSWRLVGGGYQYMIRTSSNKLQIHGAGGYNTLDLIDGNVIKIEIDGSYSTVTDLDNGNTQTINIGTSRQMGNTMTTFNAGFSGESSLGKMYGLAGIPRRTTSDEDERFKEILKQENV